MINKKDIGIVYSIKDTIASVFGLTSVTSSEMVEDSFGGLGLVLNLEKDRTGVVMFDDNILKAGDYLFRLYSTLNITTDPYMLGNVFDSVGTLINNKNYLNSFDLFDSIAEFGLAARGVELKAPGIIVRQPVYESLATGIMGIDGLLPLGQGQRELIIGDRQTGKSAIAIDVFLNQANVDLVSRRYLLKN
jgi:F-type H+-transporting ATPase subunit alpha